MKSNPRMILSTIFIAWIPLAVNPADLARSTPSLDDIVKAMELAVAAIGVFSSSATTGADVVAVADADADGRLSVEELIDTLQAVGADVSGFTGPDGILTKSDSFWHGGLTADEIDKWLWIDRRLAPR